MVYHDLVDLYGPKIGLEGVGLWITYKRFIQNNPEHLLTGMAWPSHRALLAPLFRVGERALRGAREALADAGLITVFTGRELAAATQAEQEEQQLLRISEGKARKAVRLITLTDLAAAGIRNPARSLMIEVNDPLPFYAFCEAFDLTYSPHVTAYDADGLQVWNMLFDDYPGLIRGPNRILAAARYVEDNLDASEADRRYWPLIGESAVRSLLRSRSDDKDVTVIRERLLRKRAERLASKDSSATVPERPGARGLRSG